MQRWRGHSVTGAGERGPAGVWFREKGLTPGDSREGTTASAMLTAAPHPA